jgi:hypothetical protein
MPTIDSLDKAGLVLALMVPGLVAFFIRAQFTGTIGKTHADNAVTYFVLSALYYGIVYSVCMPSGWKWPTSPFGVVALIFAGPAVFGLLLGVCAQRNLVWHLVRKTGLHPRHATPLAWDWKFSQPEGSLVLVTLKDGTQIPGLYGGNSFTSSDPEKRDMYLERVFEWAEDGKQWVDRGEVSMLVLAGEIKTVEFLPTPEQEVES